MTTPSTNILVAAQQRTTAAEAKPSPVIDTKALVVYGAALLGIATSLSVMHLITTGELIPFLGWLAAQVR